jgi:hypothetical protein
MSTCMPSVEGRLRLARRRLTEAQEDFLNTPSASRWQALTGAMLFYQGAWQAKQDDDEARRERERE